MGTYQLGRRLVAASGVVEAHVGTHEGQPVVLSRLATPWSQDGTLLERFGVTARALGEVRVTEVATLLEYGPGGDGFWFAEATGDGEPLRALMTSRVGTLTPGECVAVAERVAQGLAALHTIELVHGDVSASSLFIGVTGRVQLLHTGLAAVAGTHPSRGPARSEPHAVAPEQLLGPSTPAADVFRLGLLLLEMLTGRSLFVAADPLQVLSLAERFPGVQAAQLMGVPEPLKPVLTWLLHREPAERPLAADVPNALQLAAASLNLSTGDPEVARAFRRLLPERAAPQPTTELRLLSPRPSSPPPPPHQPRPVASPPPAPLGTTVVGRIGTRRMTHEELEAVSAPRPSPALRPAMREALVGEQLLRAGKVSANQLSDGQARSTLLNVPLTDALLLDGVVSEDAVVEALGVVTHTPVVSSAELAKLDGGKAPLHLLPQADAERLVAVPLAEKGRVMVVAVVDPLEDALLDELKRVSGRTVQAVRAGERALRDALARLYRPLEPTAGRADALPTLEEARAAHQRLISASGLDEGQTTLVEVLLAGFGEPGADGVALLQLSGELARHLKATDAEIDKVRFVTACVVAFNVRSGRPVWQSPASPTFDTMLGALAQAVRALVPDLFTPTSRLPTDAVALPVLCTFAFAQEGGSACPTPWQPVIAALKSRRFPPAALDALARVLSS